MLTLNRLDMLVIFVIFILFVYVKQVTIFLNSNLDTLPMRFAAILILLGVTSYNKLVALGVFLLITAVYIQHHYNDINTILGGSFTSNPLSMTNDENRHVLSQLDHGGYADEVSDTMDFTSKMEDQDNEFKAPDSSIDEKYVLNTEPLGTRSQNLFPDDSKHMNAMEHGNKNGYSD
jgi:hypothetical protein